MLQAFLQWLLGSPRRRPAARLPDKPPIERPVRSAAVFRTGRAKLVAPSRRHKLSDQEDAELRQRLTLEIQRKRQEDSQWEDAALLVELSEASQQRREDWLREYSKYHRTPEWESVRKRVLEKANNICTRCGSKAEAAHHERYPVGYGPTLAQFIAHEDESLIVAVCNSCHARIHGLPVITKDEKPLPLSVSSREETLAGLGDRSTCERQQKPQSSYLPKRPKAFVVQLHARVNPDGLNGDAAPSNGSRLAMVEFSCLDGSTRTEEYWLDMESEAWVVYRLRKRAGNSTEHAASDWEYFASAVRGTEEKRAAAIYLLHDAWKADGSATPPKLIEAGLCVQADIRWICSQVWRQPERSRKQASSRKRKSGRDRKARRRR